MVFSSPIFLFAFLPCVWIANRWLPRYVSNIFLCLASLVFYAWGEPVYVLVLLFVVLSNYFLAKNLGKSNPNAKSNSDSKRKKARLVAGVVINISVLFFFKYTDFALETLNLLPSVDLPLPGILLPIGVSFFIFQAMAYLIDVYRGVCAPQPSFVKVLLAISFFPQLIAGPIIFYRDIETQLETRQITAAETAPGIRRFIVGLSKKVLIANTLAIAVDAIYALDTGELTFPIAWLAALAYILQLYYDFSGYSDMALGLGRMFGFKYKENFNYPYIATNIQDFWRRWHISLSTWFKEYVYIPLGGNRKGNLRTAINKVAVFFLTGLWHGAQWTFVVWGLIHGAFLLLEQYCKPLQRVLKRFKPLGVLYTLLVVTFAFVLFRAESFAQAMDFYKNMVSGSFDLGLYGHLFNSMFFTAFACGIVGAVPWLRVMQKMYQSSPMLHAAAPTTARLKKLSYVIATALLVLCMMSLSAGTHNPFIYFRF